MFEGLRNLTKHTGYSLNGDDIFLSLMMVSHNPADVVPTRGVDYAGKKTALLPPVY